MLPLDRCPYSRGCYVQASMELGPEMNYVQASMELACLEVS